MFRERCTSEISVTSSPRCAVDGPGHSEAMENHEGRAGHSQCRLFFESKINFFNNWSEFIDHKSPIWLPFSQLPTAIEGDMCAMYR